MNKFKILKNKENKICKKYSKNNNKWKNNGSKMKLKKKINIKNKKN